MRYSSFKDLIVWQRARALVVEIYRLTGAPGLACDFGLRSQMQRAAVSIMANIAEGAERDNVREFAYLLRVAKGSAGELRSHLVVAGDLGLCPAEIVFRLDDELIQLVLMLCALIRRQVARSNANPRKRVTPGP
jgi:four helix bundle protein